MPMVMAVSHAVGEVGLIGSVEPPQPDNIAANATQTQIRIIIRNLTVIGGSPNRAG
jgi:hypothetical protein